MMSTTRRQRELSSSTTLTSSSSSERNSRLGTPAAHTISNMPDERSPLLANDSPSHPPSLKRIKQTDDQQPFLYSHTPSIAPSTSSLQENAGNYLGYIHSLAQGFHGELEEVDRFLEESTILEPSVDIKVVEIDCSAVPHKLQNDEESTTLQPTTRIVGIDDAHTLLRYLEEDDEDHIDGNIVKAFLIQGVTPQTVAVLGAKFDIDPRFWDGHLASCSREEEGSELGTTNSAQPHPSSPRQQQLGYGEDVEGALHMPLLRSHAVDESVVDIGDEMPNTNTQVVTQARCSIYVPSNPATIIIAFSSAPYRASLLHRIMVSPFFSPNTSPTRVSGTRTILRLFDVLVGTFAHSWSQELIGATKRVKEACVRPRWWSRRPKVGSEVARERRRAVRAVKAVRDLLSTVENVTDNAKFDTQERLGMKKDLSGVKKRVRTFEEGVWSWDIGVEEQVLGLLVDRSGGLKGGGLTWIAVGVLVVTCVVLTVLLIVK